GYSAVFRRRAAPRAPGPRPPLRRGGGPAVLAPPDRSGRLPFAGQRTEMREVRPTPETPHRARRPARQDRVLLGPGHSSPSVVEGRPSTHSMQYSSSLAIARLLEQVHLRPLPPVRPPPAIMWPAWRPLPCDFVARLAGRRATERAGDGQAWFRRHRSRSCRWDVGGSPATARPRSAAA